MSEETEGQDTGAEAVAGGVDPAAVALALGSASRANADAFLDKQSALTDLQTHHLVEQFRPLLRQLHLKVWEQRLGVLLRLATAFVGIVVAGGLAFLVWDAIKSNGLLIEPFSVPPDLAQRGLTGQVVAAQLLDQLAAMQAQTPTQRALKSYVNSWDEKGIKLDIPETGISLAELEAFLREKLGHETHVSGEIVRSPAGFSLTVRAETYGADRISGQDADLDMLIRHSAESIYRLTQPYRYAIYLTYQGRASEAEQVFRELIARGAAIDQSWADIGLSLVVWDRNGVDPSIRLLQRAAKIDPDNVTSRVSAVILEFVKSWPEQALRDVTTLLALSPDTGREAISANALPQIRNEEQAWSDMLLGAFIDAVGKQEAVNQSGIGGRSNLPAFPAMFMVGAHDPATARALFREYASIYADRRILRGTSALYDVWTKVMIANEVHDWEGVISEAKAMDPLFQVYPGLRTAMPTTITPLVAYAQAKLGDIVAAETHIASTPVDCYRCLITRARIAELRGQHSRSEFWFAKAAAVGPSIPFAYADWGQALLERGKPDAAIEKFKLANQKGPHFADPLEGWGEALMAKNQSHLALAKFEEAEKYAPNWGRLHLKWGEALVYAGKRDEARAQYQKASTLDLTATDKAELARVNTHG